MFVGRVDNVLIDFICNDVGVILLREVCDKQKLLLGKDFAAGVRGVAENERLGVLPQVTTISLLGSTGWPMNRVCFAASASRKPWAPQVMEYW